MPVFAIYRRLEDGLWYLSGRGLGLIAAWRYWKKEGCVLVSDFGHNVKMPSILDPHK